MANIIHEVHDDDSHFTLNTVTRKLVNAGSRKKTIPQFSHNSERFTFEFPRYIEGHDMSECNSVQVHYNNIEVKTKNQSADVYECFDMAVQGDKLTFSWLISKRATTYEGSLNFIVILKCVTDGDLNYAYPTEIYDKISVSKGIDNGEAADEVFSDILASWKAEVLSDVAADLSAAQTAAENAASSATTAQTMVEYAYECTLAAQDFAESAKQSEEAASDSETAAKASETNAAASASSAQTYAGRASSASTFAQNYANDAKASEEAASSSASAASASAETASSVAATATDAATSAEQSKNAAASSEANAAASKEAAKTSKDNAEASASSASTSAASAANAASSAASSASSALSSASSAASSASSAEAAAERAETAAGNTDIGDHNTSTTAHADIRQAVKDTESAAYHIGNSGNLINNGMGEKGDITNFPSSVFDGSDLYNSFGCFKYTGAVNVGTNDLIPVSPDKAYRLSYYIKSANAGISHYDFLQMFDIDKNAIIPDHTMYIEGSLTTVAQDINNGDTVVHLTNVSGFDATTYAQKCGFIFWDYKNSKGYQYAPETYSRHLYQSLWADGSTAINTTDNTITLSSPWNKGKVAAGTYVSQPTTGSTYSYGNTLFTSAADTWEKKEAVWSGYAENGARGGFRHGTAYVKLGWLLNYQGSGSTPNEVKLAAVRLSLDADVSGKLDRVTSTHTHYRAYGVTNEGQQLMYNVSSGAVANALVSRDANGRFEMPEPVAENNPATKKYVDDNIPTVPTKTSQLTNDSGFVTGTIPTKTSELTNDSGFLTEVPSDYVKNTDYASVATGGTVRISTDYGIKTDSSGRLMIKAADEGDVKAKTSIYLPITPATVDTAVKAGITANANELTAEEKAAAKAWLGIGKLNAKTSSDTSVTLNPNEFCTFPEMASLSITLATPIRTDIVNEYKFRFTSGSTAATLSLPATVIGELDIEANHVYELSIVDNYLAYQSWEITA